MTGRVITVVRVTDAHPLWLGKTGTFSYHDMTPTAWSIQDPRRTLVNHNLVKCFIYDLFVLGYCCAGMLCSG